jgi:hypothetical protein
LDSPWVDPTYPETSLARLPPTLATHAFHPVTGKGWRVFQAYGFLLSRIPLAFFASTPGHVSLKMLGLVS